MNENNKIPIRVEVYGTNSLNNRFLVGERIQTQGAVIQDNDMYVDQSDLSCLINAWRRQPNRLLGAWSEKRGHYMKDGKYRYKLWGPLTIMLPHPWVTKTDYLRLYGKHNKML